MFRQILSELKRRNVTRVAGLYAVSAWGVFQVANTVFQTYDLPKWTSALALSVLAFGFPIAVVVAWAFERGPDGELVRTRPDEAGGRRWKLTRGDVLLLAGAGLVLVLSAAQIAGVLGTGRATILGRGAPEKSVAVLPFVSFSAQPESGDFADGLTEEVINSLAQVSDLKVAGRTSAFYFKGRNEDIREIGKRLGVAHVVEGSVRRQDDRLRVTAQLISVKDGFHLWSKTYDRRMDDAFAIQTEVGEAVAEALRTKLKLETGVRAAAPRDPAAYQLELTSRAQLRRQGLESLKAARAGFDRLTVLEPANPAGYAGYAQATMLLAQNHLALDFIDAQRISQAAVDKAIKLDPDSAEAWLARAVVSRVLTIRIGGSPYEEQFDEAARRAVQLAPRDPEALTLLAIRLGDTGRPAEGVAAARRAVAVDPLNRLSLVVLARSLLRVGELDAAEAQYRAVVSLYPDFTEAANQLAMLLVEKGRLDQAEPLLAAISAAGDDAAYAFQAGWVYLNLGLDDRMHAVIGAIKGSPGAELGHAGELAAKGDFQGLLAYGRAMEARSDDPVWPTVTFLGAMMVGRHDEAIAALKRSRPDLLSSKPEVAVTDLGTPIQVAHMLNQHGEKRQAELLLDRVLAASAPAPGLRIMHEWRIARVKVFAERGQDDAALAELEAAVKDGWRTPFLLEDSVWIEQQPSLIALSRHPRFKALLAQVRQDLARQKAAVLAARGGAAPVAPASSTAAQTR